VSVDGEHFGTEHIVCPHCDHVLGDSWEYGDGEDVGEVECGDCEKPFYARRIIRVTYASETIEKRRGTS
jgi:hypothetical protein